MSVLPAHMSLYHMCAWCSQEEGRRGLTEAGVADAASHCAVLRIEFESSAGAASALTH